MSESNPETTEPKFSREQVVDAFRKFPGRGFTSPDDLPLDDADVISAYALLQVWDNQQGICVKRLGTLESELRHELERSTIYIDAGFSDPDYLDEVANDWLAQDLQRAEDAGLTEIASKIQVKIDEINAKIPQ